MCNLFQSRKGKLLCCGLALSIGLGGCSANQTGQENIVVVDQENNSISFEFCQAEPGDVVKTERVSCTYRQTSEQEISFDVSGRLVEKVYVKEGDLVTKGTLLAELASEELEKEIEDLEYRIARNEILLDNVETSENYDISGLWVNYIYYSGETEDDKERLNQSIEDVKRNYRYQREDYTDSLELDRNKLAALKRELSTSRIYAQMDGAVYKLKERLRYSTSKQGEVVMRIVDTSECIFEAKIPELKDVLKPDDLIEMNVSYGGAAGTYELRPYLMDQWDELQYFEVVDRPETNDSLEVGTTGTMKVEMGKRENVLCLPIEVIHTADGKSYVYVLNEDGMRDVRWVETGLFGDNNVEITSGLAEGEKVIRK